MPSPRQSPGPLLQETREHWPLMNHYERFEHVVAFILSVIIALVIALWGGQRRAMLSSAVALTLAVVVAGPPLLMWRTVSEVPRIHDITTDTADPPAFVAVLPLRKGLNPVGIDLAAIELVDVTTLQAQRVIAALEIDVVDGAGKLLRLALHDAGS